MYANPIIHGNWPKVMIDNIAEFSKKQGFNESRLPAFSNEEIELIKGMYKPMYNQIKSIQHKKVIILALELNNFIVSNQASY